MFRIEKKIVDATCDACDASLLSEDPNLQGVANFGFMKSAFGTGSLIDFAENTEAYHLCRGCWAKALAAVGLSPE